METETPAAYRSRGVVARFEKSIEADPLAKTDEISATLGVSERTLRAYCRRHLGMVPSKYIRLCRMQLVRQLLRSEDPTMTSLPEIAQRHGFKDFRRFARAYRSFYGEAPTPAGVMSESEALPAFRYFAKRRFDLDQRLRAVLRTTVSKCLRVP
jgi:transcriptional regulator GlxA family with amidase domain